MCADTIPEVSEFGSVDPAPPGEIISIEEHRNILRDEKCRMFLRMRSLFSLRNIGGDEAVAALCSGFSCSSALLRHEIAYVLGQMQNDTAIPSLIDILSNADEHVMVRHEAAEAMGAIGDQSVRHILEKFLDDVNTEVSESCEVALDLLDYHKSD